MHHRTSLLGLLPVLAALIGASACLDAGTGGRAVTVDFAVTARTDDDETLGAFTTADGWNVTLEEAHVAFGPVYLYENSAPLASLVRVPAALTGALSDALIPSARAHAGDNQFAGGTVLGELAEYLVVDALADDVQKFEGRAALYGAPQSLGLRLPAEAVRGGAPLFGHQAFVRGTATRGDDVRCFSGGTTPESDARRDVNGLPFSGTLDDGVTVTVAVHPNAWLASARLDDLTTTDDNGCLVITEGDPVAAAWSAALRSARSFSATTAAP
jgi:hypothetical protein